MARWSSVVGPPGIGKSRLVREVAAMAARREVEVFSAYCESHTSQISLSMPWRGCCVRSPAYGPGRPRPPVTECARGCRTQTPKTCCYWMICWVSPTPRWSCPRSIPDARRRRLTALVNAASLARKSPAVFVIEDAHWIDEVSESMLAGFPHGDPANAFAGAGHLPPRIPRPAEPGGRVHRPLPLHR